MWCYGWPGPSPLCMEASRRNGRRPTVRNLIRTPRITPMVHVHGTATASTPNPPLVGHGGRPLLRQGFCAGIPPPQYALQYLTEGRPPEGRRSLFSLDSSKPCYEGRLPTRKPAQTNQKGYIHESDLESDNSHHGGKDGNIGDGVDQPCELQFGRIVHRTSHVRRERGAARAAGVCA